MKPLYIRNVQFKITTSKYDVNEIRWSLNFISTRSHLLSMLTITPTFMISSGPQWMLWNQDE